MSEPLDRCVSNLKSVAYILLSMCESMDGIESINMHADIEAGTPYIYFTAYNSKHDEPAISWSDFPDGIDGEGDE